MLWAFGLITSIVYLAAVQALPQGDQVSLFPGQADTYTSTTATPRTVTSSLLAGATGAVTTSDTPVPESAAKCTVAGAILSESCWNTLKLSQWLTDWNQTVKRCVAQEGGSGVDCCATDEPWTTCFLRIGGGISGSDCTQITNRDCFLPQNVNQSATTAPQVRYIISNIVSMNSYFGTYWIALEYSITQAHLQIQGIVNLLDPEHKTNMLLGDILSSLSFCLAFIALPEAAENAAVSVARAIIVSQYMVIATQETPMLLRAAFPRGLYTTRAFQISEFSEGLTAISQKVGSVLTDYLAVLMTEIPAFIAFAKYGSFSGNDQIPLPKQTASTTLALKTYIITKAMTENHWFVTYAEEYNKEDVPDAFHCEYDANGICGENIYYSKISGMTYFLGNTGAIPQPLPIKDLLKAIVNNGWSDPGFMFDSAFNCTSTGAMMQDNHDPEGYTMFDFKDNKFNLACTSQLVVCKHCRSQCPTPLLPDGQCPFQICPLPGGGNCWDDD